jgi:3-dehydroquinate dehydratase / shikimate dehydrogenase
MLIAIIAETTIDDLAATTHQYQNDAEAFEWRLDFLSNIQMPSLKKIRANLTKPLILTLRPKAQGGYYSGSESERWACLTKLAELHPDYIDFESSIDRSLIAKFHKKHPSIRIILSYHNYSETPEDLDGLLLSMKHPDVSVYKIIGTAQSSLDNLRVLHFVKNNANKCNLVAHCMGELGLPSRVLGGVVGSCFCYAKTNSIHEQSALDPAVKPRDDIGSKLIISCCPSLETLRDIYRIKQINANTKIFALLGDPVEHSIGHVFHNKNFDALGVNAVYVKFKVSKNELSLFFKYIQDLPFQGFSVTMPLKEAVIPYMQFIDPDCKSIGAINTIRIEDGQCYATNTDGAGALDAIEKIQTIANSKILLLGAGGAAKAIAYEAMKRKALSLTIVNRTLERAEAIAQHIPCTVYDFEAFQSQPTTTYDLLINTIPNTYDNDLLVLQLTQLLLTPTSCFMNIDYSEKQLALIAEIKQLGFKLIDAQDMYANQARHQISYWLPHF